MYYRGNVKIFIVNRGLNNVNNDAIYRYDLTTPYDVSTCTFVEDEDPDTEARSNGWRHGDRSPAAQSKKYQVNTLEHTVLMNNNGRFESIKLPREAKIARSFGTEILDVDDDGILDVILAHNFFSPQRETGRMDGGLSLVLKGNGDCTFSALPHSHTGISVSGDTRKVRQLI